MDEGPTLAPQWKRIGQNNRLGVAAATSDRHLQQQQSGTYTGSHAPYFADDASKQPSRTWRSPSASQPEQPIKGAQRIGEGWSGNQRRDVPQDDAGIARSSHGYQPAGVRAGSTSARLPDTWGRASLPQQQPPPAPKQATPLAWDFPALNTNSSNSSPPAPPPPAPNPALPVADLTFRPSFLTERVHSTKWTSKLADAPPSPPLQPAKPNSPPPPPSDPAPPVAAQPAAPSWVQQPVWGAGGKLALGEGAPARPRLVDTLNSINAHSQGQGTGAQDAEQLRAQLAVRQSKQLIPVLARKSDTKPSAALSERVGGRPRAITMPAANPAFHTSHAAGAADGRTLLVKALPQRKISNNLGVPPPLPAPRSADRLSPIPASSPSPTLQPLPVPVLPAPASPPAAECTMAATDTLLHVQGSTVREEAEVKGAVASTVAAAWGSTLGANLGASHPWFLQTDDRSESTSAAPSSSPFQLLSTPMAYTTPAGAATGGLLGGMSDGNSQGCSLEGQQGAGGHAEAGAGAGVGSTATPVPWQHQLDQAALLRQHQQAEQQQQEVLARHFTAVRLEQEEDEGEQQQFGVPAEEAAFLRSLGWSEGESSAEEGEADADNEEAETLIPSQPPAPSLALLARAQQGVHSVVCSSGTGPLSDAASASASTTGAAGSASTSTSASATSILQLPTTSTANALTGAERLLASSSSLTAGGLTVGVSAWLPSPVGVPVSAGTTAAVVPTYPRCSSPGMGLGLGSVSSLGLGLSLGLSSMSSMGGMGGMGLGYSLALNQQQQHPLTAWPGSRTTSPAPGAGPPSGQAAVPQPPSPAPAGGHRGVIGLVAGPLAGGFAGGMPSGSVMGGLLGSGSGPSTSSGFGSISMLTSPRAPAQGSHRPMYASQSLLAGHGGWLQSTQGQPAG